MRPVLHEIYRTIWLKRSAREKTAVYRFRKMASAIAAMLFLPLLAGSLYFLMMNQKKADREPVAMLRLIAPQGSRLHFRLPDGSKGVLNGGSVLAYPSAFTADRQVKLTGEAYFEVAADKEHPFVVEANKHTVTVTGTKFAVTAWGKDNYTDLVLQEGKVLFRPAGKPDTYELSPGQRIVENNGKLERSEVDDGKYMGWKNGKLIFRNESLEELAMRISHWYQVDVEYDKSLSDSSYRFRGVFEDDPLEEVLRLLEMTSPIHFRVQDRQLNPNGGFSRKKVLITGK